jgi:formyltetrahydrofolate deformylase
MTDATPLYRYVITVQCPDQPGIVYAFAAGVMAAQGNILESAQFGDPISGAFCLRTHFESPIADVFLIRQQLAPIAERFGADLKVRAEADRQRMLIMVSKFDHCLVDLLYRWKNGELKLDIPLVISNHLDHRDMVEAAGISFVHLPITKENKVEQEARLRSLLTEHRIDFIVLARYMQILSPELCDEMPDRVINIHHSFLPGFKGARPYDQAYQRGVKIIGATAHYVTSDLDGGPIIEQDVVRVGHALSAPELTTVGRDVERQVLSKAVRYQAESRLVRIGHRVIVFH